MSTKIDGNITPFSGQKIPTVDSSRWGSATLSSLYADLGILQQRLFYAQQLGNHALIEQLQRFVHELQTVIEVKAQQPANIEIPKRKNYYTD